MNFIICNAFFLFERVQIGSYQHVVPLILSILFCVVIILLAKYRLSRGYKEIVIHVFAIMVSGTILIFHFSKILQGGYSLTTDLPLYLCSFLGILIPIFTYYRKYWMFEIIFFWIIAGTLQGVITPDISEGYPSFDYFRYWTVHLGLLIIMFYAVFVFNMRPRFKSVFKSFFALQIYVLLMMIINYTLDSNYFYLNEKPKSVSILDYMGDWPYYIIVTELIIIPYFLLIYLPFYLIKKN